MKKFFPLFAVIIVLVLAVCSFHIIPTGYTGVKTSFGQIQKTTIQSGKLNFCIPFVQSMEQHQESYNFLCIRSSQYGHKRLEHTEIHHDLCLQQHQVHGVFGNVQPAQHGFFRCCKYQEQF